MWIVLAVQLLPDLLIVRLAEKVRGGPVQRSQYQGIKE